MTPAMNDADAAELTQWLIDAGLAGEPETELLSQLCRRVRAAGLAIDRALVVIDTLHPILEGRVFRWRADAPDEATISEYGSTREGQAHENWLRSPFYHLVETGGTMLRRRLHPDRPSDFPAIEEVRLEGMRDYVALIHRFAAGRAIGEMDCVYSSWVTTVPEGFSDDDLVLLRRLSATLGLAVKTEALSRIAETLVETYLGRDAGRRVLRGILARGVTEKIQAVIWYSDLRSYTRISDQGRPADLIPFLNDYADAVISAIHGAEGDVLKLIGDGILAIFSVDTPEAACGRALAAAEAARRNVASLNARRDGEGLPTTEVYLGLHVGQMFYGNIGSADRLDFTVVGPAVNEASRIAGLCRSVEQPVLLSTAFAEAAGEALRQRLVSVGRFALRGVQRPQELFTLEGFAENPA
jgi:adenylate cyclase